VWKNNKYDGGGDDDDSSSNNHNWVLIFGNEYLTKYKQK
jgi:hypothetical protein